MKWYVSLPVLSSGLNDSLNTWEPEQFEAKYKELVAAIKKIEKHHGIVRPEDEVEARLERLKQIRETQEDTLGWLFPFFFRLLARPDGDSCSQIQAKTQTQD